MPLGFKAPSCKGAQSKLASFLIWCEFLTVVELQARFRRENVHGQVTGRRCECGSQDWLGTWSTGQNKIVIVTQWRQVPKVAYAPW